MHLVTLFTGNITMRQTRISCGQSFKYYYCFLLLLSKYKGFMGCAKPGYSKNVRPVVQNRYMQCVFGNKFRKTGLYNISEFGLVYLNSE